MTTSRRLAILDFDRTLCRLFSDADYELMIEELQTELGAYPEASHLVTNSSDPYVIWGSIRRALLTAPTHGLHQIEGAVRALLTKWENERSTTAAPFPGVSLTLERLGEMGTAVAVLSSNGQSAVENALQRWGLRGRIVAVGARREDTPVGLLKPSPAPALSLLRAAGADPEQSIYAGDSQEDAACAGDANIPFVYIGEPESGSTTVISGPWLASIEELPEYILARMSSS